MDYGTNYEKNLMEIVDVFKQPVARLILNENLNSLLKFCLKIRKKGESRRPKRASNISGYQSKDINLNSPEIKSLCNVITLQSNIFLKEIFNINQNLSLRNLWINFNEYKDYHMIHEHPFSVISGVFYVKTPKNCGNIVFGSNSKINNYIHPENIIEYNNYNTAFWFLPSLEGTLYLFPSWLKHYTEPNFSNESRVSISFNLT